MNTSVSTSEELVNLEPADEFDPRHKEAIDGLLWLGFLTETITYYGHKFTIKTLTRGERLAVTMVSKEYEDTLGMAMALETATVAAALISVDNRPLNPELSPNQDPMTRIQDNFELIKDWYDVIIESLYQSYTQLLVRQVQAFIELQSK